MQRQHVLVLTAFAVVLSTALAAQGAAHPSDFQSVLIKDVPHVRQKPDFCGEACAEMFLRKLGRKIDQDEVFNRAELDPQLGRGCYTRELARSLKNIGFNVGQVWYKIDRAAAATEMGAQFRRLHEDLRQGVPSIICMHYDARPDTTEHFRLIVGYDAKTDEVLYHEPAVENGGYRRMLREELLKLWPLKYRAKEWTVVRIPLKAARLIRGSDAHGPSDADYAQHIMRLKERLPHEDFQVLIQKPFVVIGDERPQTVRYRAVRTIKWAVDHLKKDYFSRDPDEIIDIWLFKDKESYETNTEKLFGESPTTPFGYYTSRHRALIMNISTGGGTLVHEIVHPFIESNFPDCPSWFNEGLASLYEQCGEEEGRIHGYTNWRLAGLKEAIEHDRVPSFKTLTATTTNEFYHEDRGTNYSQARYLCYYLQQKGLLRKFYRQFRASVKEDPTGYETLKRILKRKDMDAFKKEWQAYTLKLRT